MRYFFIITFLYFNIFLKAQEIEWIDSISYSGEQTVSKIALDYTGDIYVAGFYGGYHTGAHGTFIHKYSPLGNLLWKDNAQSLGDGPQSAGVTTDNEGNVYTAFWNSGQYNTVQIGNTTYPGGINGFLIKYNSIGQIQWVQVLPQTIVNDISVNSQQHIFLACNSTIKEFDSSGNLVSDLPFCASWMLQVDPTDAVYATCTYIQKIFAGSLQWTYPMNGNYRLTGDKNHNCYVSDMGAYSTSTIYKINSGQLVWSYTVPYWGGEGIFVNEFNKLFVIGEYGTGNTSLGQILCEYDDQGSNIWSYNIPNSANIGPGPIIEQNGSIYIGGQDKQYQSFVYLMKIKSPDAPTAVHENSANSGQFNLYPNPSGSIFNLSYEGEGNARTTLKILDAAGKIVYTKNLNDFASGIQQQLDLSSLPKGIYFLHLLGEKFTETRKIIIE